MAADIFRYALVLLLLVLLVIIGRRRTLTKRLHILSILLVFAVGADIASHWIDKTPSGWDMGKWWGTALSIEADHGAFTLDATSGEIATQWSAGPGFFRPVRASEFKLLGFGVTESEASFGTQKLIYRSWSVPDWFLLAVLTFVGAILVRRYWRRTKREVNHLCAYCGYDLRASKDRCPECGKPILPLDSEGA